MLKKRFPFLAEMLETHSPSGREIDLQKKWLDYVDTYADAVESDNFGNVYGIINPNSDFKVMLAGHGDEIAFMVRYIDSNGYLYVAKAGGINPALSIGSEVSILNEKESICGVVGTIPEHINENKSLPKIENVYIDIGVTSKEEAEKYVSVGDYVVYDKSYKNLQNNRIAGKGLDNKTGSFIVAEVINRLSALEPKVGVYAVSTVNEETNMGGAVFASSKIKPTIAIACDVTFATDQPDSNPKKEGLVEIGKGPAISFGAPIHDVLNKQLIETAKENSIAIQYELTPARTGTDLDAIRKECGGIPAALLSLPLRYMHSPSEMVSLDDIETEIDLLVKWIMTLDGSETYKLF